MHNIKIMKTHFITYCTLILLGLGFTACSNDDNNTPEDPGAQLSDDAVLYEFDNQSFKDSLNLELVLPEAKTDSTKTDSRIFLTFYNPSEEGTDQWYSVPGVKTDMDYKIYYTFENDSLNSSLYNLKLTTEKDDSSEPYNKPLDYRQVRIIAVKASAIARLTPEDLDTRDYNAVINYFGLEQ